MQETSSASPSAQALVDSGAPLLSGGSLAILGSTTAAPRGSSAGGGIGGGNGGGGGGGGGGSNMVSRDDTAAMHRLIAGWLREEASRLSGRAAEPTVPALERSGAVRAILHSLGVLAVFFRCVLVA